MGAGGNGVSAAAASKLVLCECGCGLPAHDRRFVIGHDTRLKWWLCRQIEAGSASALLRAWELGWLEIRMAGPSHNVAL